MTPVPSGRSTKYVVQRTVLLASSWVLLWGLRQVRTTFADLYPDRLPLAFDQVIAWHADIGLLIQFLLTGLAIVSLRRDSIATAFALGTAFIFGYWASGLFLIAGAYASVTGGVIGLSR